MITYVYGDIFYSPARALVNPVNTVGAMGSGLAADFKRYFPEMFDVYRELCQMDEFAIGQLMLYRTPHKWIVNFPTKRHFRAEASLEYIEEGLKKFAVIYAEQNITSVSFPALSIEEDNLAWDEVRPLMEAYLNPLPLSVFIHLDADESPFTEEKRSTRALRRWLNQAPAIEDFAAFWKELLQLVRNQKNFQMLTADETFTATGVAAKGRQRLSLKISPKRGDSIFIPETQLRDLWQYIRRAGYIMPQNLPAGLDAHAPYILSLLAQMSTISPIQLASVSGETFIGLHYISPIETKQDVYSVEL